jgi:soluble lytic murein transglycosylase-like protein
MGIIMGLIFLATQYDGLITEAAKKYDVDENLVKAIIHTESSFIPSLEVKNEKEHSRGLMQINENKALDLGVPKENMGLLFDPKFNIDKGCQILSRDKKRYPNILDQIAAYNAGSVILRKDNTYVNDAYVKSVFSRWLLYTFLKPLNISL